MNRKQLILVIGSFVVVFILIAASALLKNPEDEGDRTKVVATFYPLAYMAESIGGERVSVVSLLPYNSDPHSPDFQPGNIIKADEADLILYNGGPADAWLLDEILPSIRTDDKLIINTTSGMEFIAGGDEGEEGIDPHTWLSPKRALVQAKSVFDVLCLIDPNGTDYYSSRFAVLNQTLTELDEGYRVLNQSSISAIVVAHSAYGYIAYDYGFEQYGIVGLDAEGEVISNVYYELVNLMSDRNLDTIFVDPSKSVDAANKLADDVSGDVQLLNLYLLLGPNDDMDYLELLSQNLVNLKVGLGVA